MIPARAHRMRTKVRYARKSHAPASRAAEYLT